MREYKQKADNLKVGFTVFVGIVILLIFTVLIGTNDFVFSKTYNLYIKLDNTAGLVNGAPVTLGGYKIGEIEAIEFVTVNSKAEIRIKLKVKSEYKDQIRMDSKARITSIGILGDKFIDIKIGSPDEKVIPENSFIEEEQVLSIDNISKNIEPGIENLNKALENIKDITETIAKGEGTVGKLINNSNTIDRLNLILDKIDITLTSLQNGNGSLNKLLTDDELYNNLSASINELKLFGENLNDGKGSLGKLLTNDSLYNNINSSADHLNMILQSARQDSTIINGLLNDKSLYMNLSELIIDMNKLINDIKENPDRYINVSVF
ncbi:MAG: MlaD family protein [Ignavibacteriaceae bacterium]|jgi:phospholipid/cholesterol/gamma-HCH transport system substrate-binding protein|nr:MlaD family protein [Ignavibacteriaceae bacterium]